MPRPGAVIEVDRNTPPVLFHFGEGIRLENMPFGSRIVYPPDPLEPIAHPEHAIKRAPAKPLQDDPHKPPPRRAAESDLVVYINLTLVPMDGGHKSMSTGLASFRSIRAHHNAKTLLASRSYMNPPDSALHHSCIRQGQIIEDTVRVFHIETTVNNHRFPAIANLMQKTEPDWTPQDQAMFLATKQMTDLAPAAFKRNVFHAMRAPYGLTSVQAGQVDAVHDKTLDAVRKQLTVTVEGQTDIVTLGVPYLGPYNVNSAMNPILVVCMGLGYLFNFYRNKPVLRKGGVLILTHPCRYEFDAVQHPSYIDYYDEVLADTTDPVEIEKKYEMQFSEYPWCRELYRKSHAYHGIHPHYAWIWAAHAMDHAGDVIFVGADRDVVHRLGFKCATTLEDAFEMAEQTVGRYPSVTHLPMRPIMVCEVD